MARSSGRPLLAAMLLALVVGGCGGGGMSMTEYGERIEAAAAAAGERATTLLAEESGLTDLSPEHLSRGIERGLGEIRVPLQEEVDGITPPEAIAELHDLMWGWHAEFITVEQQLAVRVRATPDTEAGWTALSDSPEMAAYRASLAEGKQICVDFQTWLDATEIAAAFDDTPWTPAAMREVVEAALGCEWFPDNPAEVWLYPPPG